MQYERTEQGDRPTGDQTGRYRGMARHPLARRWLLRVRAEARKAGNEGLQRKTERLMRRLGMEVR